MRKNAILLAFYALTVAAYAQMPIPNAPSSIAKSCTYDVMCDDLYPDAGGHKWGDIIPACWDPRFMGPVTVTDLAGVCPPNRKEWRVLPEPKPRKVGFFTMLPNRSNRQTLTSPWFIIPSILAVGASAANVTRSRRAGASWGDASAMLPVIGLDYIMDRFVNRLFGVGASSYVIGLRTYGAATGSYR